MKTYTETREVDTIEQTTVEEVVLRMTPTEARNLCLILGAVDKKQVDLSLEAHKNSFSAKQHEFSKKVVLDYGLCYYIYNQLLNILS